jgi:hypothetical protein
VLWVEEGNGFPPSREKLHNNTGRARGALAVSEGQLKEFREHERTGRVLGDDEFQKRLEKNLGRVLRRQKPGPKKVPKR